MRRDFVKNGKAQRLHVYCCFMKKRCKKSEIIYVDEKSGNMKKMCKLSSQIDLLKTTVSKRHSNYSGLKKNMFFTRPPKSVAILCFFRAFWCHLADFGCHFGPSWIPRGVQKSCFWVSCWKNYEKRESENETRQKHQNLIEILSQNERVWEVKMSVSLGTCCKIKVFGES